MVRKQERGRRAGVKFQNSITKSLKLTTEEIGGWSYRFTDRMTYNPKFHQVIKHETPHDHLLMHPTMNLLIECKAVFEGDRFTFGRVKPSQHEALLQFSLSGPRYLGVVMYSYYVFRKRPSNIFILPVTELQQKPYHIKENEWGRSIDTGVKPGQPLPLDVLTLLRNIRGRKGVEDSMSLLLELKWGVR